MDRLGMDYDTLKEINPRIICCSISGYGQSGPNSNRPSYDIVTLAETGLLSITGEPGRRPARPGAPIADLAGGIFAVIGVLTALVQCQLTGKGQKIDIALQDCCLSLLAYQFSYYFCSGIVPKQESYSGHINSAPYGVFKTKKGYIALGACWPRITRAIGAEWLADDPRFRMRDLRVENRNELNALIEEQLDQAEADDWLEIFKIEDIPAAKVKTLDEVVNDPQILHRNMILSMEHPLGGKIRLVGNPIKMESIAEENFTPPPILNQDGGEILSKLLGYTEEKISQLRQDQENNTQKRVAHVRKIR
jgi:crotonobetainyl-CoA:carnitine CoA-transferase CaiB-like acyl-CoA transferase